MYVVVLKHIQRYGSFFVTFVFFIHLLSIKRIQRKENDTDEDVPFSKSSIFFRHVFLSLITSFFFSIPSFALFIFVDLHFYRCIASLFLFLSVKFFTCLPFCRFHQSIVLVPSWTYIYFYNHISVSRNEINKVSDRNSLEFLCNSFGAWRSNPKKRCLKLDNAASISINKTIT